jgi:uroporphyrinogen decarboxylase
MAALDAGADGIFFATQTATAELLREDEVARYELPTAERVLDAVRGRSTFTLLHVHGMGIYFDRLASLPVHALNWHDRLTLPALGEGKRRIAGAVVGGLDESRTLRGGSAAAITREVDDALNQTDGVGLLVGPGCGLPLDVTPARWPRSLRRFGVAIGDESSRPFVRRLRASGIRHRHGFGFRFA